MAAEKPKKPAAAAAQKKPDAKKEKAAEKPKAKPKDAAKPEAAPAEKKPAAPPRPPADPRLKFLKKLKGKFLPRGPLRDRHKEILQRWHSGPEHGGVTVEELQTLVADWKAVKARSKPVTSV